MSTTKLFRQASDSFGEDIQGVQWTLGRLTQIQSELAQAIDRANVEIYDLFAPQRPLEEPQSLTEPDPEVERGLGSIIQQMRASGALRDR